MENHASRQIGPAVRLTTFADPRFKTVRLSVNFLTPMRRETAALYGILPGTVSRATKRYPSFSALSRRLSALYGATLSAYARKLGGFQCLSLAASGISSRYAFGGEDTLRALLGLITESVFDPLLDSDGLLPKASVEQERRQLLDLKASEFSDKGTYTHQRAEALLFEGDPAGGDRYGASEDLQGLKREALLPAWKDLLRSAAVEIFVLGDIDPEAVAPLFEPFSALGTPQPLAPLPYWAHGPLRRVTEEQPIAQSKLSLAFRADVGEGELSAFRLMNAVLGGTPSSKLFLNVREKRSLCYYCSSSFDPLSRSVFIESGVETENLSVTEEAILEQLSALKRGEITEEELDAAKLAIRNALLARRDSLVAMEGWYLSGAFSGPDTSPEAAVEEILRCTPAQVAAAAEKLTPGVFFVLKGGEGECP